MGDNILEKEKIENKIKEEVEKEEIEIKKNWIKEIEKLRKEIRKEIEKHYNIKIIDSIPICITKINKKRTKYLIEISFIEYLKDKEFNRVILNKYLENINKIITKYNLKKVKTKSFYLKQKHYHLICLVDSSKEKTIFFSIEKDKNKVIFKYLI